MTEDRTVIELVESLEGMFKDVLNISKAIANEKRLRILIALITGEKSFDYLKSETKLEKSALANHLVKLKDVRLVMKPDHGIYQITGDGKLFLRVIEGAYRRSDIWEKKNVEMLESRQFSDSFVKSFFNF